MNFPTSPTLNQTYSLGDKTWKWNGVAWDLQSTGLTSAHVISALGYTPYNAASLSSALSPYLLSATASSTYLALAGGTLTGNLAFSGTGLRITGDFSNATLASRLMFQTSTTNGNTGVYVIPNGTSQISTLRLANNSDPTNAGHIQIQANSSEASVTAGISGSGAYLPLAISVGGSERGRFTTGGDFGIGTSSPKVRAQFSAGSAQNAPTLGTALGIAYFSNNDANYGLLVGNSAATGAAWLQAQRTDGTATAYDLLLNPAGGNVTAGGLISDVAGNVRAVPPVGTKTGSYTLVKADVGKYVQVGSGGSITIPTSVFAEGDVVSLMNNTTGNVTITCSAPTAYKGGINTVVTSLTLQTRGIATVFFISSTVCIVTGNLA